jgi:hypothetical protein
MRLSPSFLIDLPKVVALFEKLTMFPMSPDDHLLTNRKKYLIRSKQTPDPSVQFLVNMQTVS